MRSQILNLSGAVSPIAPELPTELTWGMAYPIAFLAGTLSAALAYEITDSPYYSTKKGTLITAIGAGIFGFVLPIVMVKRSFRDGYKIGVNTANS